MVALILAGGKGLRLAPFTRILPKPLLPVGGRPVLAVLLERLRLSGVDHAYIALGYLGDLIRAYFSTETAAFPRLSYLTEREPLGTAGPLALLPPQNEPFLVVNGDILTDLPFADLYRAHLRFGGAATIAARAYQQRIEYGHLRVNEDILLGWDEKPVWQGLIGIGAYVLAPEAQCICPPGPCEMPALIQALLETGRRVHVYITEAYWRDIGALEEYAAANREPPDFLASPPDKPYMGEG